MEKRLLNIKEVSEYLGISQKGLYNMIYRREIPFIKIGGRVRFDIIDLDKWIERQKIKSVSSVIENVKISL